MAKEPQDDAALIQQARQGDLEAFNVLVLRHQDRIYSVSYRIMGEGDAAADATQETFLTAFNKLGTYRGGKFIAWLSRIATNICYDELRRRQRRPVTSLEDLTNPDYDDEAPLPSPDASPEQVAQQHELQQAIENCILALKTDQRTILVLCDIQDMSYKEVAATVGVQMGTVKSRLSRARLNVRDCLQNVKELLPTEYRLMNNEN